MSKTPQPALRSGDIGALLSNAVRFMQGGMAGRAKVQCELALKLSPQSGQAHHLLGMIAIGTSHFDDAARHLTASLEAQPGNPAGRNNLGVVLKKLGRLEEAAEQFRLAIVLSADYADAHHNLGNAQRARGDLDSALACFRQVAQLRPDSSEAFNNQAEILLALGRTQEALALSDRAIALNPHNAKAHNSRGSILAELRRFGDALGAFGVAISLAPADPLSYSNRGAALIALRRHEQASVDLDIALALDPSDADALENRATAAAGAKRPVEAAAFYARLLAIAPDHPFVLGNLLHAKMLCSDWDGIHELAQAIRVGLANRCKVAEPFGYQGIGLSESDLLACAEIFSAAEFPPLRAAAAPPAVGTGARITVGYLCGEFRRHATTLLMCGAYEMHDKERFRVIALDNGGADQSPERKRVEAAFEEIVDISGLSDDEAADRVRTLGVDILVNLNGYFGEGRMGVFARRPSPVQVNYLGFPGTFGAPYMDYLIADDVVIPPDSRRFYSEKVATVPHTYQANDNQRAIAPQSMDRAAAGLPAEVMVYCCFNNNYKILPATFDVWMRILHRVPSSCLWLLQQSDAVAANLRREAQARGIAPERLVFAGRLPPDEHLARHALADLFLDTWPYNAHTTASDALWAGLPLLTRTGGTFPGRVAASLLLALGLPDLIAGSDAHYEELAVQFGSRPQLLGELRSRLKTARGTQPLFDTALFTRHLEAAYAHMAERARSGQPPAHFDIPAVVSLRNAPSFDL